MVQEVQAGGPRDITSLKALAAGYVQPRLNKAGFKARVRAVKTVEDRKGKSVMGPDGKPVKAWSSSLAKAGRQHIASGASRLRSVVEDAAQFGGKIAFTVRARRARGLSSMMRGARSTPQVCDAMSSSGGMARRSGSTPTTAAARSGEEGFDGREFKAMVDATGGDVAAAVQKWLVDNDRIEPGARIVGLESRAWKPDG
ncbi:hypothetical protein ACFYT4_17035 [Streptomyces sp. NPDC004609]|uniref:hypothetical protein n=1 Tax=Streptomyces sp. NPDC004609 TaxID=3364704 RepID=UPI00367478E0